MYNSDILLWFIRKRHRNKKYDLFLCSSLCHFGSSHSLRQNPLNVNQTHTSLQPGRHNMHNNKHMKTSEGSGLVSGSWFIRYLQNLGHKSIWRKTNLKKHFHKRQAVGFPSERLFELVDIHSTSHNPIVVPQSPLKSARITYDTISCNNEATKETGI